MSVWLTHLKHPLHTAPLFMVIRIMITICLHRSLTTFHLPTNAHSSHNPNDLTFHTASSERPGSFLGPCSNPSLHAVRQWQVECPMRVRGLTSCETQFGFMEVEQSVQAMQPPVMHFVPFGGLRNGTKFKN